MIMRTDRDARSCLLALIINLLIWAVIIVLAMSIWERAARAADISTSRNADGSYEIRLDGYLDPGDEATFAIEAAAIPPGANVEVLLSSGGGSLRGMEIGRLIYRRGFKTIAYRECASMCAAIWLASSSRSLYRGTMIGFHKAGEGCAGHSCPRPSWSGNMALRKYLNEINLSAATINYFLSVDPPQIEWMTPETAKANGIVYAIHELAEKH